MSIIVVSAVSLIPRPGLRARRVSCPFSYSVYILQWKTVIAPLQHNSLVLRRHLLSTVYGHWSGLWLSLKTKHRGGCTPLPPLGRCPLPPWEPLLFAFSEFVALIPLSCTALFQGLLHFQFLIICSMQKRREKAWGISSCDLWHSWCHRS